MIDFENFKLTRKPNQYLLAPAGLCANAEQHAVSETWPVSAADLLERVRSIALATPRVTQVEEDSESKHIVFVARSKVFRFPDEIDVRAIDMGDGQSALAIYARARVGIRDFGVNKKRIEDWLSRLTV